MSSYFIYPCVILSDISDKTTPVFQHKWPEYAKWHTKYVTELKFPFLWDWHVFLYIDFDPLLNFLICNVAIGFSPILLAYKLVYQWHRIICEWICFCYLFISKHPFTDCLNFKHWLKYFKSKSSFADADFLKQIHLIKNKFSKC